jgi:coproporphyrinogen III oxidase-like Fe-S oxidoreductase
LATWDGEDYVGIGYGAHGRIGLSRTRNYLPAQCAHSGAPAYVCEMVSETFDRNERLLFKLRTSRGLNPDGNARWKKILEKFSKEGLLHKTPEGAYKLIARGFEVCDSIIAELL